MTLGQLELFSLMAELRSFTSVAQHLGISQSAVSHGIKSLEKALGVTLFERHQSDITLTDIGVRLLPRAREMIGLSESIHQEVAATTGIKSGTLRIGSFGPTSSLFLLPRILADFRDRYPGIAVSIDEGNDCQVTQWLLERRIDVGFIVMPDERFTTYPLMKDHLVAVLPKEHSLAHHSSLRLEQLCEDPFIMTQAGSSPLITRLFAQARLQPNICYRNAQLMSTLSMIERGEGVALIARNALPDKVDVNYRILDVVPTLSREVALAILPNQYVSLATEAFIKTANKQFYHYIRSIHR